MIALRLEGPLDSLDASLHDGEVAVAAHGVIA
jgi:hypothetical protein